MSRAARLVLVKALTPLALAMLLTGCSSADPVYVSKGTSYTAATIASVFDIADTTEPATESALLRHSALAALRRSGADASAVADLLTRSFPSDTRGVPVYVERATFDGKPAVVVVEATGPSGGHLDSKRIWVLGERGDVYFAGSR